MVLRFCHPHIRVINAGVVTHVAGSPEAVGLPRYPEYLFVEINVMKSWQTTKVDLYPFSILFWTFTKFSMSFF